jgi:hypothetical protein
MLPKPLLCYFIAYRLHNLNKTDSPFQIAGHPFSASIAAINLHFIRIIEFDIKLFQKRSVTSLRFHGK